MDIWPKKKRSEVMSRIKGKNTKPELVVRSMLHRSGYRFRLHRKTLPGTPDIVLPKYKTVIFVHGCFWHRHRNCKYAYYPKTRKEFWLNKFGKNIANDEKAAIRLASLGWRTITVWECQIEHIDTLKQRILRALNRYYL